MNAINLNSLATFNMTASGCCNLCSRLDPVVQQAFFVDTCLLAASYPECSVMDAASRIILRPDLPTDAKATQFDLPGGLIMNGNLASVQPITNCAMNPSRRGR